jgi:hypothetical protein
MKTKEEIEQLAENSSYNNSEHFENYQDGMFYGYIKGYNQCQEDMAKDQTLTRFEVIDEYGRAYSDHYCKVELSYQDDGRTLKVIIKRLNKQD